MAKLLEAGTPLGEGVLQLRRMSGQEELGRLPEFQLEFISRRGDISAAEILGKNLSWSLQLADGGLRYFNGFVTRFSEAGDGTVAGFDQDPRGHAYFYQASVHPWLWFLTRASNCRIFQKLSVLEIADAVFGSYPFANVKKVQLRSDYPKRDFSVQYRETDFNFVCRLFEQEGLYFAFEYDNGRNTLVLMDSHGAHRTSPALESTFFAEAADAGDKDHVGAWAVNREIQPGKYTIDDFNYLKPQDRMSGDCAQAKDHDLAEFEIYDYPGEYHEPAEGVQYARTRIEELHVKYEEFSGSGNVRLAAPGRLLKLQDHPRRHYNAEYLVTSVSYTASVGEFASGGGSGGEFHCGLAAIGAATPFRPARVTPKPIIQGPQTAIVVGKAGEEIHTDDEGLGRIKVQFHWDRYSNTDENSSCWVRVAQPLAGSGWGFLALPRVGHEVVVEFLEGDPDQPIVTGSVYNQVLKPPYALPTEKTRSGLKTHSSKDGASSNFNELRFEDKKGEEEIYFHAEKDKGVRIKNDRREWIGNNSHLIVTLDAFEKIDGDHHVTIAGNRNEKLDGSLSLDIGQNLDGKVGTKLAYDAGSEIHLKAGSTLVLESGTTLSLKVGGNFITIDQSGIAIKGTLVQINTGGAAGTGSGAEPAEATLPEEAGNSQGGDMPPPPTKVAPSAYSPQAQMFEMAAASGTPFCEVCNC
jgi:type VI secretion system secreted protein VgrG